MSPAANAISDELTLAGSLPACEAALVSPYTAKYPSTAQSILFLDSMEQAGIPGSWARRATRVWYHYPDNQLEFFGQRPSHFRLLRSPGTL